MKHKLLLTIAITILSIFTAQATLGQININIPWGKKKKEEKKDEKKTETKQTSSQNDDDSSSSDEVYKNSLAPADLDYNLKIGDKVFFLEGISLNTGIVLGKKGRVYKINDQFVDRVRSVDANAVYPHFVNVGESGYYYFVKHKMQGLREQTYCYNKLFADIEGNRRIEGDLVATDYRSDTSIKGSDILGNILAQNDEFKKYQVTFEQTFPNSVDTYLPKIEDNPGLLRKLFKKGNEISKCIAQEQVKDRINFPDFKFTIEKLNEKYPAYEMTKDSRHNEAILFVFSPYNRKTYLDEYKDLNKLIEYAGITSEMMLDDKKAEIEKLRELVLRVFPTFTTAAEAFAFKNPQIENMLIADVRNQPMKVIKSGVENQNWKISANDFGIPRYRYKNVNALVQYTNADYPFCYLYRGYVKQQYSGGGTYSKALTFHLTGSSLFNCVGKPGSY